MTLVRCDNCGTKIQPRERRIGYERGDRDQPPYEFSGCVLCAPSSDDLASARDAHDDRRMDEERA